MSYSFVFYIPFDLYYCCNGLIFISDIYCKILSEPKSNSSHEHKLHSLSEQYCIRFLPPDGVTDSVAFFGDSLLTFSAEFQFYFQRQPFIVNKFQVQ